MISTSRRKCVQLLQCSDVQPHTFSELQSVSGPWGWSPWSCRWVEPWPAAGSHSGRLGAPSGGSSAKTTHDEESSSLQRTGPYEQCRLTCTKVTVWSGSSNKAPDVWWMVVILQSFTTSPMRSTGLGSTAAPGWTRWLRRLRPTARVVGSTKSTQARTWAETISNSWIICTPS